jgi:trehalose-6-phosphate synthase
VPISKEIHDDYYLTVGAARIWMVFHRLPAPLAADALDDIPWQRFVEVNRRVAAAAAELAPPGSRVTVHDYTLLPAVPEIRRLRGDVSLVYVHHIPWPNSDEVTEAAARQMLSRMASAAASSDAVSISAQHWKTNLESWSTGAKVGVVHPGIDSNDLLRRVESSGLEGCWMGIAGDASRGPIIAAVGRVDPSKNFDTLLKAWMTLVADGLPGTLCLHLIPTTRWALAAYQDYARALYSMALEANRMREGSVVIIHREAQDEALQLLRRADVVVVCSSAEGWNLVAVEACALGADSQRLILSAQAGAVEVLAPIAEVIHDPLSHSDLAAAIRLAIEGGSRGRTSRRDVKLPTTAEWWNQIMQMHISASGLVTR